MATGADIKALRKAAGLTQGDVGARIGMRVAGVCEIETGKQPLGALEAARMMTAIDDIKREREESYQETLRDLGPGPLGRERRSDDERESKPVEAAPPGQGVAK